MKKMYRKMMACLTLLLAVVFSGCGREEQKNADSTQADALFYELRQAYISYADSLSLLPVNDTTGCVEALEERFDRCIKDIYWRYPQNLDYELTSMQNDTLWHYALRYIEIRNRHASPQKADTVPTIAADTVSSIRSIADAVNQ